jgi:hypothetical protein
VQEKMVLLFDSLIFIDFELEKYQKLPKIKMTAEFKMAVELISFSQSLKCSLQKKTKNL